MNDVKNASSLFAEMSGLEINQGKPIEVSHFSHIGGRLAEVLNNADPNKSAAARNQAYRFVFREPMFVRLISISGDDLASYRKFELSWKALHADTAARTSVAPEGNTVSSSVGSVITEFSVTPPDRFIGTSTLRNITVQGMTLGELVQASEHLAIAKNLKVQILNEAQEKLDLVAQKEATVATLEAKKTAIAAEIAGLTTLKEQLVGQTKELQEERERKTVELNQAKELIASAEARSTQVEDQINQKTEQAKHLNAQIVAREGELRSLKNDISLFPVEISGFAREGISAVYKYIFMGLIPSAILAFLAFELYNNAQEFQYLSRRPGVSIWELLLSRLPYVVVTVMIVEVCFRVLRMFMVEVIAIFRQRLNLSKLSVIAKDVTDAALEGTSLSDDERFERRLRLKMMMLKEHLKEYLPGGFEYQEAKRPAKPGTDPVPGPA
jgi:hypothetical protein